MSSFSFTAVRVVGRAVHMSAALRPRLRLVRQPEADQRHAGEADAEFLQRRAARDRLGQTLGEFIELVVHNSVLQVFDSFTISVRSELIVCGCIYDHAFHRPVSQTAQG